MSTTRYDGVPDLSLGDDNIKRWIKLFQKANRDCSKDGECVVQLTDVDFHAEQINNLTDEVNYDLARKVAERMAQMIKEMK